MVKSVKPEKNKRNELSVHKQKPVTFYRRLRNDWMLYLMIIPVVVWYLLFAYIPMGGMVLAFKQFTFDGGIWGSPWVGFKHFYSMLTDRDFLIALKNTLIFSFGKLLFQFPAAILLAVLLNEITNGRVKKFFQTVFTFPHFISWVVMAGILTNMFASNGIVNQLLSAIGLDSVAPLVSLTSFRPFVWLSNIWKEIGWDTIIYLAALSGIDPGLYEAAEIDGAGRLQKMSYVTLPGIKSTIAIMLILEVGRIMTNGANFDQIFNLYSSPVYMVADTIDTYIYRTSFSGFNNFGYTTALGLFKSFVGVMLLFLTNKIVSKNGEQGLF